MPPTEFIWLTARETKSTPQCCDDVQRALSVQDEWFARAGPYSSIPGGSRPSGVALWQQIEDATVYLMAGRSASTEQHQQWQRSEDAASFSKCLEAHFIWDKSTSILVDDEGSAILTSPSAEVETPLLDSPVISVGRCSAAPGDRAAFAENWNSVKGLLEDFAKPHSVKGAWRVKGEADAAESDEEFVMLCGWPSVERHMEFATWAEFPRYSTALREKLRGADIKHYRRVV
ncbi:hypothetical protein PG994_000837 [Apiospora phragmitis]|uniref:Monooxygenase n=1 Tax=Apiospora phragmitis TaxID=2905665 RepID=A0ABR1X7G8_9PEZI